MSNDISGPIVASDRLLNANTPSASISSSVNSSDPGKIASEFGQLAMPLADILYATAYRMTGNAARAEDLVQETYVRAWEKFREFQTGSNFKAWIFRILIFTSRNEWRTQRKQPTSISDDVMCRVADEKEMSRTPAPIEYADFVDDVFKQALDRLDSDYRTILLMVTLGELSYKECAEILSIPVGTVMSRLYRARKQLQADLRDYAKERGLVGGDDPDPMETL